jgi:hypothetical protein
MSRYRFYFLNADDRIVTVVDNAVCVDDAAAATIAVKLVGKQSKYPAIEIWQDGRRVSQHRRTAPAGFLKTAAAYFPDRPRWLGGA